MITEKQELFPPEFSVRFVTRRMIIEKQKLFTPVFSEVRTSLKTGDKQFLLL
jgi:hypothetical protein